MLLVGLTGGIAAGKSTVAAHFAKLGAHIIDADVLARQAVAIGTPGLAALRVEFGDEIIATDGSLDRAALGALVFGNPELRKRLEQIVHPEVQKLSSAAIAAVSSADPEGVVIYDIPLLAESDNTYNFDRIVVVNAPANIRHNRLMTLRGMSEHEAAQRIAAQATDEERLALATDVIDSSGSLEHTLDQVDELWRCWHAPRERD